MKLIFSSPLASRKSSRVFSGKEEACGGFEWTPGPGAGSRKSSCHNLEALELESDGALFCFSHLPRIYQAFLMSATFNEDVQTLKELVLHNPVSAPTCDTHVCPPCSEEPSDVWGGQSLLVQPPWF